MGHRKYQIKRLNENSVKEQAPGSLFFRPFAKVAYLFQKMPIMQGFENIGVTEVPMTSVLSRYRF
jgi:hypothetical protein